MNTTTLLAVLVAGLIALTYSATSNAQTEVTFESSRAFQQEWTRGITGKGVAKWEVVSDDSAPSKHLVLRQSGEATYCWAVRKGVSLSDGYAEVKIKPVAGKEDQAGGIVFRFQDENNYYVVRANALEDNVVLYKTVNGKRSSLPVKGRMFGYGVDVDVPQNEWSTLRVDFKGNLFIVSFQGKELFQVEDDTITDPGSVGVWTKADSNTLFDDFRSARK
jgi:hypothetical protein